MGTILRDDQEKTLIGNARALAMRVLQSDLYYEPDTRCQVDEIISVAQDLGWMSKPEPKE